MGCQQKKTYLPLVGEPILVRTTRVFDTCTLVDSITVVVAAEDVADWQEIFEQHRLPKLRQVTAGGTTRQESVALGLQQVSDADLVIVHDGVRPFVTHQMITDCVQAAYDWGAATAAVPVKDTIKFATEDGFVQETLERSRLWAIQTPQVFRYELLAEAHAHAVRSGLTVTDDAALVEEIGHPVKLVLADARNLKITTPEDLVIAEALVQMERDNR